MMRKLHSAVAILLAAIATIAAPILAFAKDKPAAPPDQPADSQPVRPLPEIKPVHIEGGYAVVVSQATHDDPEWSRVVEALVKKYGAKVIVYKDSVNAAREDLARVFPRYACFVAQPEEAGREFVIQVHRLTRQLDDDPYTDVIWGILTGYSADDALRIAAASEPLVVRKGAGGTDIPLDVFDEGVWYSEGEKGAMFEKTSDGKVEKKKCPDDSTQSLVDVMNTYQPDLFVTSGHASDRDWQIGYSYPNGQFRCRDGLLVGIDLGRHAHPIESPNPKVYLPLGNCLMGRIRDKQSMALAFMRSGGVNQMCGYVVSTWFGYGGWGVRDYFLGQPGRFTLAESCYANNQALINQLETKYPKAARVNFDQWDIETDPQIIGRLAAGLGYTDFNDDVKNHVGLLWDRDTVAFYGDPAWEARLAPHDLAWDQTITEKDGTYTVEFTARQDTGWGRPPLVFFPHRVKEMKIVEGEDLGPTITDNFLMLSGTSKFEKGKTYKIVFEAKRAAGE